MDNTAVLIELVKQIASTKEEDAFTRWELSRLYQMTLKKGKDEC